MNPDVDELNDDELEMAAQIIGESLSEDGVGLLSSLYYAVLKVDEEGISYERSEPENRVLSHLMAYNPIDIRFMRFYDVAMSGLNSIKLLFRISAKKRLTIFALRVP